jgi:hypothetical protein
VKQPFAPALLNAAAAVIARALDLNFAATRVSRASDLIVAASRVSRAVILDESNSYILLVYLFLIVYGI